MKGLRILALAAATLCAAGAVDAQNLFKMRRKSNLLIADHRASAIGDILTVVLDESSRIKNEDKVDRSNSTSLEARLDAYTLSNGTFKTNVLPRFDVTQDRTFEGNAKQEKDVQMTGRIAAIVVDVLPNGNLVVAGTRVVMIDDETKTLRISGIVRPLDVTGSNTVASSLVADARIAITGEGGNQRMVTRGPVATVFDTLIWAAWPF